jgi:hypothetical protein
MVRSVSAAVFSDGARFIIALVLCVGTLALLLTRTTVPDVLWALDGAAVSFYFSISIAKNSQ